MHSLIFVKWAQQKIFNCWKYHWREYFACLIFVGKAHQQKLFKVKNFPNYDITVILKILVLFIFVHLIFVAMHYSQLQEAINICCGKNSFKLNFRVFTFCGFFQQQILNNYKKFPELQCVYYCSIGTSQSIFIVASMSYSK